MAEPYIVLGMPGYGALTGGAAKGYWRATRLPDDRVYRVYNHGSLLANNFNRLWCAALNLAASGVPVTHFAMQHADIEPEDWWLDTLAAEMDQHGLDVLAAVVPIKSQEGVTSQGLARPDGSTWRPLCRLTTTEVQRLPETFTGADTGHPLLLNTGLWTCRFNMAWAPKVRFTINDRIMRSPDGRYHAEVEPEDWYFSRLCHELGLKLGATRKVRLTHRGDVAFPNDRSWGEPYDSAYVAASVIPTAPDAKEVTHG